MARSVPIPTGFERQGGPKGDPQFSRWYLPRCPACLEAESRLRSALVDESGTFSFRPQNFTDDSSRANRAYRYQEYRFLSCDVCGYSWFAEPTGRWSTRSDSLTSEPWDKRPALLIDEATRRPLRDASDIRRIAQIKSGRFSDIELAVGVAKAPVLLVTGAGASVHFGFPLARDFRLPDWGEKFLEFLLTGDMIRYGTISKYLSVPSRGHRLIVFEAARTDMEILMDTLLRLQQLCIHEGGDAELKRCLSEYPALCPSWFVFQETSESGAAYPPLNRAKVGKMFREVLESSEHLATIRRLLRWVTTQILTRCSIPDAATIKNARGVLRPLIDGLSVYTDGALPIFTTNYDELIEATIIASGERGRLHDGFEDQLGGHIFAGDTKIPFSWYNPHVWTECQKGDIALFHLHGASCYLV